MKPDQIKEAAEKYAESLGIKTEYCEDCGEPENDCQCDEDYGCDFCGGSIHQPGCEYYER